MVTNWKEIGKTDPKYSIVGDKHRGDGSYENPFRAGQNNGNSYLGAGNYKELTFHVTWVNHKVIGAGINNTRIDQFHTKGGNHAGNIISHMTIGTLNTDLTSTLNYCLLERPIVHINNSLHLSLCILKFEFPERIGGSSNVFYKAAINTADASFKSLNSLFANCTINLTQKNITDFANAYIGFDNCTFKVGNASRKLEPKYRPVNPEVPEVLISKEQALREDFINLLESQGIIIPEVTSTSAGKGKMTKWLFDDESMVGYRVIENSMLDHFMNENNVSLGGVGVHGKVTQAIRVTTDAGKKASINPGTINNTSVNKKLTVTDGEVLLNDDFNINFHKDQYITSNIISLNGRKRISELDFMSNLPINSGYVAGSFKGTEKEVSVTDTLQAGRHYLVRVEDTSKNGGEGIVTYDGKVYSSASGLKTNAFYVKDAKVMITSATNAKLYLLRGSEMYHPIEMRIVDSVPNTKIQAGTALVDGMWYFVNPNSKDPDAFVTYGTVKYEQGSSFIARGTGSFTATGDCHLLACYKDDYTFVVNKNEQQPIWFDIDPTNPMCIMSADPTYASSMKLDASSGDVKKYTY